MARAHVGEAEPSLGPLVGPSAPREPRANGKLVLRRPCNWRGGWLHVVLWCEYFSQNVIFFMCSWMIKDMLIQTSQWFVESAVLDYSWAIASPSLCTHLSGCSSSSSVLALALKALDLWILWVYFGARGRFVRVERGRGRPVAHHHPEGSFGSSCLVNPGYTITDGGFRGKCIPCGFLGTAGPLPHCRLAIKKKKARGN
jgi:hypothetical protein